jgi:hypothetical protein
MLSDFYQDHLYPINEKENIAGIIEEIASNTRATINIVTNDKQNLDTLDIAVRATDLNSPDVYIY